MSLFNVPFFHIPGPKVLTVEENMADTRRKSDCNSAPMDARTLFLRQSHSPEVLILFLLHQLPHLLHLQSLSISPEQGSSKLLPTSQILPCAYFFVNKVQWNTAMFMVIWLHIVSGCFYTTKAELSGCHKTLWKTKARLFTHWLFTTKVCQHLVCGKFWTLLSERCNRAQEKQLKLP